MTPDEAARLGDSMTPALWGWLGTDRAWRIAAEAAEPMADPHLYAWRSDIGIVWRKRRHGRWLQATCLAKGYVGGVWHRFELPPHDAPFAPCTCGFYAAKKPPWWWRLKPFHRTWRVELAGLVIEHKKGWRAARIRYIARR